MVYDVGITVGVFDLFHVGHLNLLEKCHMRCNRLLVAVCDDSYVRMVKNIEPVFSISDRIRIVSALRCVDEVFSVTIEEIENKMLLLKNHPFDVLFSGSDWKGSDRYIRTEHEFSQKGVHIEYFPYTVGISTTLIKERINGI